MMFSNNISLANEHFEYFISQPIKKAQLYPICKIQLSFQVTRLDPTNYTYEKHIDIHIMPMLTSSAWITHFLVKFADFQSKVGSCLVEAIIVEASERQHYDISSWFRYLAVE